MAVDDRYKRASATALIVPFMFTAHTDTTLAVDAAERQAATWMYNGIASGSGSTVSAVDQWFKATVRGIEAVSGEYVYIIGDIKHDTIQATNKLIGEDSPYTVIARDTILFCDTSSSAITVNLPVGIEGTNLKVVNCGTNDVTVDPNGTEQLFGAGAGVAATLATGENIDIHYNETYGWW
jgi:hypothetical protein